MASRLLNSIGSQVLDQTHLTSLEKFFHPDGSKYISLDVLYSCSNDESFSVSEFHANCDGKGPTIAAIKIADNSSNGSVIGGYTSISWTSSPGYKHDGNAVLFNFAERRRQRGRPAGASRGLRMCCRRS